MHCNQAHENNGDGASLRGTHEVATDEQRLSIIDTNCQQNGLQITTVIVDI